MGYFRRDEERENNVLSINIVPRTRQGKVDGAIIGSKKERKIIINCHKAIKRILII
jgi:hypothetical protein